LAGNQFRITDVDSQTVTLSEAITTGPGGETITAGPIVAWIH
jgi:hypothetical protein